jgi:hypothetical protein
MYFPLYRKIIALKRALKESKQLKNKPRLNVLKTRFVFLLILKFYFLNEVAQQLPMLAVRCFLILYLL